MYRNPFIFSLRGGFESLISINHSLVLLRYSHHYLQAHSLNKIFGYQRVNREGLSVGKRIEWNRHEKQ